MADTFDPTTSPAYQEGAALTGDPIAPIAPVRELTHEEFVLNRLNWIVAGVWVVAGAVILNFIVGFILGFGVGFEATYR